ncbi:hypothetical protein ACWE42_06045 [Sutcliffiella cohnii]
MKNKLFPSLLCIFLVFVLVITFKQFFTTPEDIIDKAFVELKNGNLVYGLKERDASKIFDLLVEPNAYNLPNIELHTVLEHQLDPHIVQHTFINVHPIKDVEENKANVTVTFSFDEYNKDELMRNDQFILERKFQGNISFQLMKAGWNSWEIIDVKTTNFTEYNVARWNYN